MKSEIQEKLEQLAYDRTTPFCYGCYIDAPTGVCRQCHSDDLMRHLAGVGVEWGTSWVETCTKCGGRMKIIAAIEDPTVIRKILHHMGLETKPPPLYPARGPPKVQHHFEDEFFQQHFEMNFDNFNQSAD